MNRALQLSLIIGVTLQSVGCKYDGSFLNMSSDSPMPFLGLQLSVQNQPTSPKQICNQSVSSRPMPDQIPKSPTSTNAESPGNRYVLSSALRTDPSGIPTVERPAGISIVNAGTGQNAKLVPVSSVSEFHGRVRYSLSDADSGNAIDANEVQLRLSGF